MGGDDNIKTKPRLPPKPQLRGGGPPIAAHVVQGKVGEEHHQMRHSRQKPSHAVNENADRRPKCLNSPVHTKPVPKPRLRKPPALAHGPSQPVAAGNVNVSGRTSLFGSIVPSHIKREGIKQHEKPRRVPPNIPLPPRPLPKAPREIIITNVGGIADCDGVYMDADTSTQSDYWSITPEEVLENLTSLSGAVQELHPTKPIPASRTCEKQKLRTQEHLKPPEAESITLENLRSELCRLLSSEDRERNGDTKKPKSTKDLWVKFILSKRLTRPARGQWKFPQIELCPFQSQNKAHTIGDKTRRIPTEDPGREAMQNVLSVPMENEPLKKHTSKTSKYHEHSTAAMLPSSGLEVYGDSKPNSDTSQKWSMKSLWQDRCVVKDKGILSQLTKEKLLLQESMYEVVTSEQMYLDGLTVAVDHFQNSQELNSVLTSIEHKLLFSGLCQIREISQNFLSLMVQKLDSSLFCDVICDVVHQYATGPFDFYVDYIRNMPYQKQALINLRKESPRVVEVLSKLEEHPCCNRLPLESFLCLPFQRISRLKILMEMVLKRTGLGSDLRVSAEGAVREVSKVLEACNREVGKMKQMEELVHIANKTAFQCKSLPLVSSSRWLVKEGDMVQLSLNENIFSQKRISSVHLFLFNDLLLVTTKKGSDRYVVCDHVHRSLIEVSEGAELEQDLDGCDLNLIFQLALVKNHRGATSHFLLQSSTQAERDAWLELLSTQRSAEEGVYEEWDCPQARCVEVYHGNQPGELSLEREDIVSIFHKTTDGYMEGRRLHDGQIGRFPAACVVEISSEHVQRRHLRERYHVLQTAARMLKWHIRQDCHTTNCFR